MSIEALKSHLFETLEGLKNNSDPDASECEKVSIEQAKAITAVSGSILDIYKLQLQALDYATRMDNISGVRDAMNGLGIVDTKLIKQ